MLQVLNPSKTCSVYKNFNFADNPYKCDFLKSFQVNSYWKRTKYLSKYNFKLLRCTEYYFLIRLFSLILFLLGF